MSNSINYKIGNVIKKKRHRINMSQELLGEKIGVTKSTISRYECGKIDIPLSKLNSISEICNFPMRDYTSSIDSSDVPDLFFGFRKHIPEEKELSLLTHKYYSSEMHKMEFENLCSAYDFIISTNNSKDKKIREFIIEIVIKDIKDETYKKLLNKYVFETYKAK